MDLLDFYRGTLSARRLWVLIEQLRPHTSRLARELNDGQQPFSQSDNLAADLWILTLKLHNKDTPIDDHPQRAAMEEKARAAAKLARVIELRATFEKRKRAYGLG